MPRIGATWHVAIGLTALVACRSNADARETTSAPAEQQPVAATVAAPTAEPSHARAGTLREITWRFETSPFGPTEVVVAVPDGAKKPLPVLIALHGRGEALKGPHRGARGWIDDYGLPRAVSRLSSPPLTNQDLQGYASRQRLSVLNQALSRRPYEGLIVVCPYLPDILRGTRAFSDGPKFADYIVDVVLPRVYRETPAITSADATGIDGVSLGGRASLLVGLLRPRAFGAVGALQPAIDGSELRDLSALAQRARAENPKLAMRLITSTEDYFLDVTRAFSSALNSSNVAHDLYVADGPHDYSFNRGPGVYELLIHYDRVLRGATAVGRPE